MNVRGQIFRRIEQPQKSLPAHARGRFTGSIPWGSLLIPGPLVVGPYRLLDRRIFDDEKAPTLHVSAAWRTHARLQDLSDQFTRHRVRFQPPHRASRLDDLEQVGGVRGCVRHGVLAGAQLAQPRLSDGIA